MDKKKIAWVFNSVAWERSDFSEAELHKIYFAVRDAWYKRIFKK